MKNHDVKQSNAIAFFVFFHFRVSKLLYICFEVTGLLVFLRHLPCHVLYKFSRFLVILDRYENVINKEDGKKNDKANRDENLVLFCLKPI